MMRAAIRRAGVLVAAAGAAALVSGMLAGWTAPAMAGTSTVLYAAVKAAGSGNCSAAADACTLSTALGQVAAGEIIELITPGGAAAVSRYVGNWSVGASGTSSSAPVTIEAAPGLSSQPILDGDGPDAPAGETCSTASCDGQVLTVPLGEYVALRDITVADADNTSSFFGGGLANSGTVTITRCSFVDNAAIGVGGAIASAVGAYGGVYGTVTVTDSTFTGNTAGWYGGAIDSGGYVGDGSATLTNSTFTGNSAESGGAISNSNNLGHGTMTVTESTFSGNTAADDGGAIDNSDHSGQGPLTVTASTFYGNTATDGGAIDNDDNYAIDGGTVTVAGDVFDGSCDQLVSGFTDDGYNAGSDTSCFNGGTGDVNAGSGSALDLGSLASNGGPTQTIMPLKGSPVIGMIPDPTGVGSVALCPATDQRGDASVAGAACDAGAVQTGGRPWIKATVSSKYPASSYGWYQSPVTVTFACKANAAPLKAACPKPVTLSKNGAGQSVTKKVTGTDGRTASVTVSISIDRTSPVITVHGAVAGRAYDAPGPAKITCTGADPVSGLAGPCTVTVTRTASKVSWRATATSRAGITATATGHAALLDYYIAGAPYKNGRFTVTAGHAYQVTAYVATSTAPRYVDAAPAGTRPHHDGPVMTSIGTDLWAVKVTLITQKNPKSQDWNAGVLVGKTLHLIALQVSKS